MGGCQNYDPFLGTLNIRCRIIIGTQKGTIISTKTEYYRRTCNMLQRKLCSLNSLKVGLLWAY